MLNAGRHEHKASFSHDNAEPILDSLFRSHIATQPNTGDDFQQIGRMVHENASRLRDKYMNALRDLNAVSKAVVGCIREDTAVVNAQTAILHDVRLGCATALRLISLVLIKKGSLALLSETEVVALLSQVQQAAALIMQGVKGDDTGSVSNTNTCRQLLAEGRKLLLPIPAKLLSPEEEEKDGVNLLSPASNVMHWQVTDTSFLELQLNVETELETDEERIKLCEEEMLMSTSFLEADSVLEIAKRGRQGCCNNAFRRLADRCIPEFVRLYPRFYALFFAGMLASFLQFVLQIGASSNTAIETSFLPVPGYYNLAKFSEQRLLVPLIYAFMHVALYCFCWLPVPFARGLWRDVSKVDPRFRKHLPIDDVFFFHKLLGIITLICIFIGAGLYLLVITISCRMRHDNPSCKGFDVQPLNGQRSLSFTFNPLENVLALRKAVWILWFPILPLLHWTHVEPPGCLPKFVRQFWYEFVYYGHNIVAHVSFVLAMVCRFEVFFPALIGWGLYYVDSFREMLFRSYHSEIIVRPALVDEEHAAADRTVSSLIHLDQEGMPTAMKLVIEPPQGMEMSAGQIVYLKVPEVSAVEWHPFSLASGSHSSHIELQVAIRGCADKKQWNQTSNMSKAQHGRASLQRTNSRQQRRKRRGEGRSLLSSIRPEIPPPKWNMIDRPTWTFKLQALLHQRISNLSYLDDPERQIDHVKPLLCQLRGPYGSTFTKCFNPKYTGCVVIGAGSGLTAALSVLREVLHRKKQGDRVPLYIWFVWVCQRVDDLLWCWHTLHELLMDALAQEVIKPGARWNEDSTMMDWLGVTIYVSRGDRAVLQDFVTSVGTSTVRSRHRYSMDEDALLDIIPAARQPAHTSTGLSVEISSAAAIFESEHKEAAGVPTTPVAIKEAARLAQFAKSAKLAREVHDWMSHKNRLLSASADDPDAHIGKLLSWARVYIDRKVGHHKKMAVSYCGPPDFAHTISKVTREIGSGLEFSADHQ